MAETSTSFGKEASKPCVTMEYFVHNMEDAGRTSSETVFFMEYEISMAKSTNNIWTDKFVKTVGEEHYIMTDVGLIGTVGGTLGLFVGLSFLDMGTKVVTTIRNGLSKWVWKKRKTIKASA